MSDKVFAAAVAAELFDAYGFGPGDILILLQLLWPLIQQLPCFRKNQKMMEQNIDAEYRLVCKKKRGRCPPKLRNALADEGHTDRDFQDDFWAAACKVSFANSKAVAAKMAAA